MSELQQANKAGDDVDNAAQQIQQQATAEPTASEPGQTSRTAELEGPSGPRASGIVPNASGGSALPANMQSRFGKSLGADVSGVRVHTGGESDKAARSRGARAFAQGNDVHFASGEYNPDTEEGKRLLAHEVAHTVQQQQSAPQEEGAASKPGDSTEREADHASEAMVAGEQAQVSATPQMVARKEKDAAKEEEDKKWAEGQRAKIQGVQDAVTAAIKRLNDEGTKAIGGLKQAQDSYTAFERKYNAALLKFQNGVDAAKKAAKELQENITFVAKTVLTAYAPVFMTNVGAVTGHIDKATSILKLAGAVGGATGILPPGPKTAEPTTALGPSDKTDWKSLISTAISTFDNFIKQNKALAETAALALKNERFLGAVVEGKGGEDPRASEGGQAADKMASNASSMIASLDSLGVGLSNGAVEFGKGASIALDAKLPRDIEQDIAIKWMSTLTKTVVPGTMGVEDQTEEIDDARSYLKELGIEKRLGHDAGMYMVDADQHILWMRAQTEQGALARVGNQGEYLGGKRHGDSPWYSGKARFDGVEYNVVGNDLGEQPGGSVLVEKYDIGPLPPTITAMKRPADSITRQIMHGLVTFTVQAVGKMGGGALPNGPTIKQG
jgi:hypothetical protein